MAVLAAIVLLSLMLLFCVFVGSSLGWLFAVAVAVLGVCFPCSILFVLVGALFVIKVFV